MSLWIPKRDGARRWLYLVEGPVWLTLIALGLGAAILLVNLLTAPGPTLLVCFALAATGPVLIGVAKAWGSARMSGGMRFLYWLGWGLLVVGTALTLLGIGFVSRH